MKRGPIVFLLCLSSFVIKAQCPTAPVQEICLAGVDSLTETHMLITWEKPADVSGIDGFLVYREVTLNTYACLDTISVDSLSEFHDYSANIHSTFYRYKMATLDTCGNVSVLGQFHRTIFMQHLGSGNYQWSSYLIENSPSTPVAIIDLMRDDNNTGAWHSIATISGTQNTITDIDYFLYPSASRKIVAHFNYSCNPTRSVVNTVYSNVITEGFAGINGSNPTAHKVRMYPNPSVNEVSFELQSAFDNNKLEVYNNLGQLIFDTNFKGPKFVLHTETFAEGIYSYKLSSDLFSEAGTLIKINK